MYWLTKGTNKYTYKKVGHPVLLSLTSFPEYLARGSYNLFYIDYSDLARGPCYVQAVHNLRFVGRCLGLLLDRILETGTRDIHLIGFSLGAQLANFASIAIRPYTVNRITGLDPAMPLYVGVPKDDRLDASDAKFVDVYHTNAFVQGKVEQCGDVDFYFNGGIIQPGCTSWKDSECFAYVSFMFHTFYDHLNYNYSQIP